MSDPLSNYSDEEIEDAVITFLNQTEGETSVEEGLVNYDWTSLPFTGEHPESDRIVEVITGSESIPSIGRGVVEDGDLSWGLVPNRDADFNVNWDADSSDVSTGLTEAVADLLSSQSSGSSSGSDDPIPEPEDPSGPDGPRSWRGDDGEAGTDDDLQPTSPESDDDGSPSSGQSPTDWATGGVVVAIIGIIIWWRDQQ